MGMQKTIHFQGEPPAWERLREAAAAVELPLTVRMIDNLPAFPDETPEPGWREVRVSTARGMMTLRMQPGRLLIVVWGNADAALQEDWRKLADAFAIAIDGTLDSTATEC